MSPAAWLDMALHIPLITWILVDNFKWVNFQGDRFKAWFFTQLTGSDIKGNPITWVTHTVVALGITAYVASHSLFLPETWHFGLLIGSAIAFGGYIIREIGQAIYHYRRGHSGYALDGFMDIVGPALVFVNALTIHLWMI